MLSCEAELHWSTGVGSTVLPDAIFAAINELKFLINLPANSPLCSSANHGCCY